MFVDVLLHHTTKQVYILHLYCKSTFESSIITGIQRNSHVLMKLEPCIILEIFLKFSDFEPRYSFKLHS